MSQFWQRVSKGGADECWPFNGYRTPDGYGRVGFKKKIWLAHRLAWVLTYGAIPESSVTAHGTVIRHTCDNPSCCNPQHLVAGTQIDNIRDRTARGRDGNHKGEAHGKAKLTAHDVVAIRASAESHAAEASKYSVTKTAIWQVRNHKNWRHIQ